MATKQKVGGGRALNFANSEEKARAGVIAVELGGTVSSRVYSATENILYVNERQFKELEKARKKGTIHYVEYNPSKHTQNNGSNGITLRQ